MIKSKGVQKTITKKTKKTKQEFKKKVWQESKFTFKTHISFE